jgi:hypothetical protein
MKTQLPLVVATLAIALVFGSAPVAAQSKPNQQYSAEAKKPKKSKTSGAKSGGVGKASGVVFYDGSAENPNKREARLRRECKGRPNAGACAGYTH